MHGVKIVRIAAWYGEAMTRQAVKYNVSTMILNQGCN